MKITVEQIAKDREEEVDDDASFLYTQNDVYEALDEWIAK